MKKVLLATVAAAAFGIVGVAQAEELWDPHLEGVDEGLAAGALPPKGVYFVNDSYFVPNYQQFGSNKSNGNKLAAYVDVPILLWNPGIKFLGADYAAAVAQPFDYTGFSLAGNQSSLFGTEGNTSTYNTVLIPVMLSWALPYDFHVKPSFGIYFNDAGSSMHKGDTPSGGLPSGMANTTFEPGVGLSWLHDGWNVSAQLGYDTSTADDNSFACGGCKYQSGDQFFADYTVTKQLDKWTVGLGGYQTNQLQRDQQNGVDKAGTVALRAGLGPIVGYQFGGINVQAQFNHAVVTHNDVGGDFLNVRVLVPLY